MPESIPEAVKALLKRLGFDRPDLAVLFDQSQIVAQVATEWAKLNSEAETSGGGPLSGGKIKPADLAYREVSRRLYTACQIPPTELAGLTSDEVRDLAGQSLGLLFYRWVWRRVRPEQEVAEDLTNEALRRVFEKLDSCHSPATFLKWAEQIVLNLINAYFRNRATDKVKKSTLTLNEAEAGSVPDPDEATLALAQQLPDPRPGPEAQILSMETQRELLEQIARLKTTTKRARYYKQILMGKYFEGLSYEELAVQLVLSSKEVHKMHYEALRLLRRDKNWLHKLRPPE